MLRKLTIVTTCSNQKRGPTDPTRCLGRLSGKDPKFAAKAWVESLQSARVRSVAATIYAGSHWLESLRCVEAARERFDQVEFLILSAGYGLLTEKQRIATYSASFAPGRDSVLNLAWPKERSPRENQAAWWRIANELWGNKGLAGHFSGCGGNDLILVILSREYFGAVERELAELSSAGKRLLIVGAGIYANLTSVSPVLKPRVLPFSDRFKAAHPYLAKTNVSLNARLANWLIREHGQALRDSEDGIYDVIEGMKDDLPDPVRKPVVPMTDDEVLEFIISHYPTCGSTATPLLRHLRDQLGKSCEQKRFGGLFRRFIDSKQGGLLELQ